LRRVKEFRKNPHVQISFKSPYRISQSLVKNSNLFEIRKSIPILNHSLEPNPAGPSTTPARTPLHRPHPRPAGPAGPRTFGAPSKYISFKACIFWSRCLLSPQPLTCGPYCQAPLPTSSGHSRCQGLGLEMPPSCLNSPLPSRHLLNPSLPCPAFNGIKAITPAITNRCRLPAPIKGRAHPWASPRHFPLSPGLPHAPLHPCVKLEPPPLFAFVAPPLCHRPSYGEPLIGSAVLPSSSLAFTSKPRAP
jgi:hypothetical protein